MYSYLTPDPLTVEIRNAAGSVEVELVETSSTTVEVTLVTGRPLGFLDDVFRAIGQRPGRGWPFGPREQDEASASGDDSTDPVRLVRVEHTADGPDGGLLTVDTDPARDGWRSAFAVKVTAPVGSGLRITGQSTDVRLTGTAGRVEIRTASGDVQLSSTISDLLVQTASGDVGVDLAGAGVDVRTVSGDVRLGQVAGDALVHTTSGDVGIASVGGNLSARSVSGDVAVGDTTAGLAEVDAVSGDVEIGVHPGSRTSVTLTTLTGRTDTAFQLSEAAPEGEQPALEIRVRTTSGDIRLHRAA